jgi:hypothetical protein
MSGQSFIQAGTILRGGMATKQGKKNGANLLCANGEYLGVKPGEFEFIEAPKWVLDIHIRYPESPSKGT